MVVGRRALRARADALAEHAGAAVDGDGVVEHAKHRLVEPDVDHLPVPRPLRVP